MNKQKIKIKRSEFEDIIKDLIEDEIHRILEDGGFEAFLDDFLKGNGYKNKAVSLLEKFETLCQKLEFKKENNQYSCKQYEKILEIDRELYDKIEKVIIKNHRESFNPNDLEVLKKKIQEEYEIEEDCF